MSSECLPAGALMLQGTGSDVGKSLLVAGLCRVCVRRGLSVRPFKPQNMSNNAAVTADGGEIGRAQALQARACRVAPTTHMNPVLLKPQTDVGAQVVVCGRVEGTARASSYQRLRPTLLPRVLDSFRRIAAEADVVLVEGAGSPAEVNLREGDIANMGFAEAAGVPVVLVGDIDRGGVIASLVGTWALLPDAERRRIAGFIVNKFRGDLRLFDDGVRIISERTGWRSFGVVPWFADAGRLPAEDAVAVQTRRHGGGEGRVRVAVPVLSRIANFDDLDPLIAEPDVAVRFVQPGEPLPGDAHLVVLPGSKSTLGDLAFLREQGWDIDLSAHARRGGAVIGLCGGYQMLGTAVHDPDGIEGPAESARGLGLLPVETVLTDEKTLVERTATETSTSAQVHGYEMHMGRTEGPGRARPMLVHAAGSDGAVSADGRIAGCYLHGLFAADGYRHHLLRRLGAEHVGQVAFDADVDATLDRLAEHLEAHLDVDALLATAQPVSG